MEYVRNQPNFESKHVDYRKFATALNHYCDIIDKRHTIELGSYKLRSCGATLFIYVTGLALPRLDTVLKC